MIGSVFQNFVMFTISIIINSQSWWIFSEQESLIARKILIKIPFVILNLTTKYDQKVNNLTYVFWYVIINAKVQL